MTSMNNYLLRCLVSTLLLIGATPSLANWTNLGVQTIRADKKSVSEVLRDFAASQQVDIQIDPAIEGMVSGTFKLRPDALLNTLGVSHRFKWYFEDRVLQIVPDSDLTSTILSLPDADPALIKAALVRNGLLDPKFPVIVSRADGTMRVSGPKRYVDMIRQAVILMDEASSKGGTSGLAAGIGSNRATIRVFPLKHVWATDTKLGSGNTQTTVPGVASVLKKLFDADERSGSSSTQNVKSMIAQRSVPIRGTNSSLPIAPSMEDATREATSLLTSGKSSNSSRQRLPQIEADMRQNAVVIRDVPERLATYAQVIAQLDKASSLIEIDVQIIEVTSGSSEQLGIDWRFRNSRVDIQRGQTPQLGLSDIAGVARGGAFTALTGSALSNFILRVNALVECGDARVEASPKILTMANIEALIENRSEFQVKVAGNLEANLFTVSAGTVMRVTPIISSIDKERAIAMNIQIEDGEITQRVVDGIPIINRNTINTQAAVKEGESLLIAGYSRQVSTAEQGGVPVLSDLPILGALFRDTKKRTQKVERFVLISPRIVNQLAGKDEPVVGRLSR